MSILPEPDTTLRRAALFTQATAVFSDKNAVRLWLRTPQFGLNGVIPLDLAETAAGFRQVEKLLVRIDHGVYA